MQYTTHTESGSASIEMTTLAGALAVMCAGVALAMPGSAGRIAGQVGTIMQQAIESPAASRHTSSWHAQSSHGSRFGDPSQSLRVQTPRLAVPTPASLHGPAWHRGSARGSGADPSGRFTWSGDAAACAACIDGDWSSSFDTGSRSERVRATGQTAAAGFADGFAAALNASAQAAIVASDAHISARWHDGPVDLRASVRAQAAVGASAQGQASLRLQRAQQHLELGGRAVAGATVRAQAQASAHIMSIGIEQALGAEGWAGVGAAGTAHISHDHGKFQVRVAAGAALGLGGQLDAQATVDLSHLDDAARASASAAARLMRHAW